MIVFADLGLLFSSRIHLDRPLEWISLHQSEELRPIGLRRKFADRLGFLDGIALEEKGGGDLRLWRGGLTAGGLVFQFVEVFGVELSAQLVVVVFPNSPQIRETQGVLLLLLAKKAVFQNSDPGLQIDLFSDKIKVYLILLTDCILSGLDELGRSFSQYVLERIHLRGLLDETHFVLLAHLGLFGVEHSLVRGENDGVERRVLDLPYLDEVTLGVKCPFVFLAVGDLRVGLLVKEPGFTSEEASLPSGGASLLSSTALSC